MFKSLHHVLFISTTVYIPSVEPNILLNKAVINSLTLTHSKCLNSAPLLQQSFRKAYKKSQSC